MREFTNNPRKNKINLVGVWVCPVYLAYQYAVMLRIQKKLFSFIANDGQVLLM